MSLSRIAGSIALLLLSAGEPLSAGLPQASLSSSLGLLVLVGFVLGEVAGDAVTGGGREY